MAIEKIETRYFTLFNFRNELLNKKIIYRNKDVMSCPLLILYIMRGYKQSDKIFSTRC